MSKNYIKSLIFKIYIKLNGFKKHEYKKLLKSCRFQIKLYSEQSINHIDLNKYQRTIKQIQLKIDNSLVVFHIMKQPLLQKFLTILTVSPNQPKTTVLELYQNHEKYNQKIKKFHQISLYIFILSQIIWFILSFNIITLNQSNYFIKEFQRNFNKISTQISLKQDLKFNQTLSNVISIANDYTTIRLMIWLSHSGFQVIFLYMLYANRFLLKNYKNGFKEIFPILLILSTIFVIRDCLLISVSSVISNNLRQMKLIIESQENQLSAHSQILISFLSSSLISVDKILNQLQSLEEVTYLQQIWDIFIVFVLSIQISQIYFISMKCCKYVEEIKNKKQFEIQELKRVAPCHPQRKLCEFEGTQFQEKQYGKFYNDDPFFGSQKHLFESQKRTNKETYYRDFTEFSQKQFGRVSNKDRNFFKKQKKLYQNINMNQEDWLIKKMRKSGSCNFFKSRIDQELENKSQLEKSENANNLKDSRSKMKKQVSFHDINQTKSFDQYLYN